VDYDSHILFAESVNAHSRGDDEAGRFACEALLSKWDLPDEVHAAALCNSVLYTRRLKELIPETDFIEVEVPTPAGWAAFNPSILLSRHGLVMAVRSSNWEFKRHHYFRVNAPDGIARSANYLLRLNAALRTEAIDIFEDGTDRTGEVESQSRGY